MGEEKRIECGIVSCQWCKPFIERYGVCECEGNIILKFRAAFDAGKGTVVMVECLNMVLPETSEAA